MMLIDQVTNAAGLYAAGIICPGELWNMVEASLAGQSPEESLKRLFRRNPLAVGPRLPQPTWFALSGNVSCARINQTVV
jgi:hypothetical protein